MFPLNGLSSTPSPSQKPPHAAHRGASSARFVPSPLEQEWLSLCVPLSRFEKCTDQTDEICSSSLHCLHGSEQEFPNGISTCCSWREDTISLICVDWEINCAVSLKVTKAFTLWSSNPLLGIYPREKKIHVLTKTCTQIFIAALFIIRNSSNVSQLVNRFNNEIATQRNTTQW